MLKALCVAVCIVAVCGVAQAVEVDLDKIAFIESSNNPDAYNSSSGAVGMYQITLICLRDYNLAHIRGGYDHTEMFQADKGRKVAEWYLNKAIPRYLKAFGLEDTLENRLRAYNWGVGNLRRHYQEGLKVPKETRDYIVKYNKL